MGTLLSTIQMYVMYHACLCYVLLIGKLKQISVIMYSTLLLFSISNTKKPLFRVIFIFIFRVSDIHRVVNISENLR